MPSGCPSITAKERRCSATRIASFMSATCIQWGGSRISKASHPDRWAKLVDDGIIDDRGQGTPLSAAMKVRSELLKMQRMSADAAQRYAIGKEVDGLNDAIKSS